MGGERSEESLAPSVTQLLVRWSRGETNVQDELFPSIEGELRKIARAQLRSERRDHTLQTTALVNEAYLRLVAQDERDWSNRSHFFGISAHLMRRILVDHARARGREKRGGSWCRVTLTDAKAASPADAEPDLDVVGLDQALDRLAELDPNLARLVELRYFAGMTVREAAAALDISPSTLKREWRVARLWLARELDPTQFSGAARSAH